MTPATHRLYIAPGEWPILFKKCNHKPIGDKVFLGLRDGIAVYESPDVKPGWPIYVRIEDDGIKPKEKP